MKLFFLFSLVLVSGAFLSSCSSNLGGEEYDVSNPYAAPEYADENTSPYGGADVNSNVNPAYDAPAVYEDTAAYEEAAPVAPQSAVGQGQGKVHTVVRGDTLWGIGKKYSVSVDAIKAANGLTSDVAVLGAKLQIPAL